MGYMSGHYELLCVTVEFHKAGESLRDYDFPLFEASDGDLWLKDGESVDTPFVLIDNPDWDGTQPAHFITDAIHFDIRPLATPGSNQWVSSDMEEEINNVGANDVFLKDAPKLIEIAKRRLAEEKLRRSDIDDEITFYVVYEYIWIKHDYFDSVEFDTQYHFIGEFDWSMIGQMIVTNDESAA